MHLEAGTAHHKCAGLGYAAPFALNRVWRPSSLSSVWPYKCSLPAGQHCGVLRPPSHHPSVQTAGIVCVQLLQPSASTPPLCPNYATCAGEHVHAFDTAHSPADVRHCSAVFGSFCRVTVRRLIRCLVQSPGKRSLRRKEAAPFLQKQSHTSVSTLQRSALSVAPNCTLLFSSYWK